MAETPEILNLINPLAKKSYRLTGLAADRSDHRPREGDGFIGYYRKLIQNASTATARVRCRPGRWRSIRALKGKSLPNTGGINPHANMLVTKTLLIAGEGWGGAPIVSAYDKKTGAIVGEVSIPGMMGSMPMTYTVGGKQYIAFTVGTPKQPAEVVTLALSP